MTVAVTKKTALTYKQNDVVLWYKPEVNSARKSKISSQNLL